MRRSLMLVAPLTMFALATTVLAGGPDCDKHAKDAAHAASHGSCTMSKQECVKHMAEAKDRGWLGIQYDNTEDGTSVVKDVVKGSPAERAGFRSGDVLYALNGIEMNEANADRVKNNSALIAMIEAEMIKKPKAYWLSELEKAGVPCGPVLHYDEVFTDPHVLARDMYVATEHPSAGSFRTLGVPVKLSETPGAVRRAAPTLGQHTNEVLVAQPTGSRRPR